MPANDIDRSFGFLMHDVSRLIKRDFDKRAQMLGLTRSQWQSIAFLSRNEGINQNALADILDIEPISMTRQLDRLEAAGWVERQADPDDRRARLLFLTSKASGMVDRMWELAAETRERALAGLSAAEHDQLIDNLIDIKSRLSTRTLEAETADPEAQGAGNV